MRDRDLRLFPLVAVLLAVLAGCAPDTITEIEDGENGVKVETQDDREWYLRDGIDCDEGDRLWVVGRGDEVVIAYCDADGHPMIRLPDGEDETPEFAEHYAARLAAGARTSRQLAAAFDERMAATAAAIDELVDQGLVEIVEDGEPRG